MYNNNWWYQTKNVEIIEAFAESGKQRIKIDVEVGKINSKRNSIMQTLKRNRLDRRYYCTQEKGILYLCRQ